jgi:Rrf2 family protein
MKLSLRGEYALRALIALGESYEAEVVPMQTVSDRQAIPKRFLEQILNDLRAGGFVESKRGIAGGYRLAQPPQEITLAQVIRHIEGTLGPMASLSDKALRLRPEAGGSQLAIQNVIKQVRSAIVQVLGEVTLAELSHQARQFQNHLAESPDYAI